MSEKLQENIEQAPVEQHNEQLNNEPFSWEYSFNREERRRLNPTDRITTSMYRADGDYSGDFTEERLALRASTRGSDKRKAMGLEASYNSLALAKHFNVIPAIEELEESVIAPLEQQDKDTRTSKLEVRIGQTDELKTQAAREKRLAELNKKIAELDEVIAKRRQATEEKAQKKLEEKYGPSWDARHSKYIKEQNASSHNVAKAAGKLASKNLVTPIAEPEEDVIEAPKVEVVKRGSIEEANREASGVDANEADIALLAGAAAGGMFGDREAREERINKWRAHKETTKDIEGVEVVREDDVEIHKEVYDRAEVQSPITELDIMDEAQPKRRGFFGRVNDKILGLGVKLTNRNVNRSPEENRSRKKKIAIVLAGAVAVGTALYLANQGDDNSRNFLSEMWPFGGEGGSGANTEVANQTQTPTGTEMGTGGGEVIGPEAPDANTQPNTPESPVAPVEPTTPKPEVSRFVEGSQQNVQHFRLESGGTLWEHVADTIRENHSDWTEQQVQTATHADVSSILAERGEDFHDATHYAVGTKF